MKKALLVVSFGTSHKETRKKTIEACENKISKQFSDYDFYRAYTSDKIIQKIKNREDINIDNPIKAIERLYKSGYEEVIIQPFHIITGKEFNKLKEVVELYNNKFKRLILGRPLLTSLDDIKEVVQAIKFQIPKIKDNEAILFMGHGTSHKSHSIYKAMEAILREDEENTYIATVEGYPDINYVVKILKEKNIKTVNLMPLMLTVGYHGIKDMVGDNEESWKSILECNEFKVNTHLIGLGENPRIQDKFVKHACECK